MNLEVIESEKSKNKNILDFANASENMRALMLKINVNLPEPDRDVLQRFASLPNEIQIGAIQQLNFYSEICEYAAANNYDQNDLKLTWYALSKFGLKGPSELFSTLSEEDCIEIYSATGTQMFRSFNFFKYCSYSPEDLLTSPWQELYDRDTDIISQMEGVAGRALMQAENVFSIELPNHKVWELRSTKKVHAEVSFRICSPLFDEHKKRSAFLVSSRIELLKESPKQLPREPEASL